MMRISPACLVTLVGFLLYCTCSEGKKCGERVCRTRYKPVCGTDGNTYHNKCEMKKYSECLTTGTKIKVAYKGECDVGNGCGGVSDDSNGSDSTDEGDNAENDSNGSSSDGDTTGSDSTSDDNDSSDRPTRPPIILPTILG
ncbi:hypothetical protein SK128_018974 [Halocaridina rubra]|uniref:Kazal-like domain-containing protein n=1 Tax=Halocaridina rubra TaxID=373956 RepID=A0AAN9AAV4_HALRR